MDIDKIDLNSFLNRYVEFVDKISDYYKYESNIKHLLYLIIPAFIIKYDLKNEKTILNVFENIPIFITGTENKTITASFSRTLSHTKKGYITDKLVIINEYKTASFLNMLDNIIHEYNHAVNSINNEISYDDLYVKVRTGLCYALYDKNTLKYIKKTDELPLEEVINTYQSSEIINIINDFNKHKVDNTEFNNALYVLNKEIGGKRFESSAYVFDSIITKELINNKTFTPTICNLRFKGLIDDIPYLFDNVMNREGEYARLNKMLSKMHELELKYSKSTFFRNKILNELKRLSNNIIDIIEEYDRKCIFK